MNPIRTSGNTFPDPQAVAIFLSGLVSRGGDRGSISALGYQPNKGVIALDLVLDDRATYRSIKVGEKRTIAPSAVAGEEVKRCRAIHFHGRGEQRVMLVVADEGFLAGESVKQVCLTLETVLKKDEGDIIFAFNPNEKEEAYLVYDGRLTPIRLTGFSNPVMTRDGSIIAIGTDGGLYRLASEKVARRTVETSNWNPVVTKGYEGPVSSLSLRTQMRNGSEYASGIGGITFLDLNLSNFAGNEIEATVHGQTAKNVRLIGAVGETTFAIAERSSTDEPWMNVIAVPPAGNVSALYR